MWKRNNQNYKEASIIPDILTLSDMNTLIIIDAKYYPELDEMSGESKLPQSGDISKQFIYRKALSLIPEFISKQLFNIFVLPGVVSSESEKYIQEIARVSFEIPDLITDLGEIIAFQIDTELAMREYLRNSIQLKNNLISSLIHISK